MSEEIVNQEEEVLEEVEEVEEEEVEETEEEAPEEEVDWEARAKKAEATIIKHKKEPKPEEPKEEITNPTDSDRLDRIELKVDYPVEIVDEIMELGGPKALENKVIKETVDRMLKRHNAEKAATIKKGSKSAINVKYSKEDLEKMSSGEMEKILPHADQ